MKTRKRIRTRMKTNKSFSVRKRIRTKMKIKGIRGGSPTGKGILLRSKEEKDISLKKLLKKMTPDELKELAKDVGVPEDTVIDILKDMVLGRMSAEEINIKRDVIRQAEKDADSLYHSTEKDSVSEEVLRIIAAPIILSEIERLKSPFDDKEITRGILLNIKYPDSSRIEYHHAAYERFDQRGWFYANNHIMKVGSGSTRYPRTRETFQLKKEKWDPVDYERYNSDQLKVFLNDKGILEALFSKKKTKGKEARKIAISAVRKIIDKIEDTMISDDDYKNNSVYAAITFEGEGVVGGGPERGRSTTIKGYYNGLLKVCEEFIESRDLGDLKSGLVNLSIARSIVIQKGSKELMRDLDGKSEDEIVKLCRIVRDIVKIILRLWKKEGKSENFYILSQVFKSEKATEYWSRNKKLLGLEKVSTKGLRALMEKHELVEENLGRAPPQMSSERREIMIRILKAKNSDKIDTDTLLRELFFGIELSKRNTPRRGRGSRPPPGPRRKKTPRPPPGPPPSSPYREPSEGDEDSASDTTVGQRGSPDSSLSSSYGSIGDLPRTPRRTPRRRGPGSPRRRPRRFFPRKTPRGKRRQFSPSPSDSGEGSESDTTFDQEDTLDSSPSSDSIGNPPRKSRGTPRGQGPGRRPWRPFHLQPSRPDRLSNENSPSTSNSREDSDDLPLKSPTPSHRLNEQRNTSDVSATGFVKR